MGSKSSKQNQSNSQATFQTDNSLQIENSVDPVIQGLLSKFKEIDLNQIKITKSSVADVSAFQKEKYKCDIKQSIIVEGTLTLEQKPKLEKVGQIVEQCQKELSKIGNGEIVISNKVACPMKIGSIFQTIENIFDFDGKQTSLQHQQGQVMLIDFWATWCGPCQMPMQHNQDMLTKNTEIWGDKVKIVGLGMDNTIKPLIDRVNQKKWNKIEHYHVKDGFKHPSASGEYQLSGIPNVVLFDKQGKMLFQGHPMEVNLEEWITCLAQDKEFVQKVQKKQGDLFEDIQECIDLKGNEQTIKHNGEVLLIDFWATWCGPCQKPMQHNQDMMKKNKDKWNGKVRIIGLGMDDELKAVQQKVEQKQWNDVEHYQLKDGFDNEVAKVNYKVEGVPNIIIIGKNKKLLYQGHPSSIDLEEVLNKLAEDQPVNFPSKDDETEEKGDNNELKNLNELFNILATVDQQNGPLSKIDDSKKPWFIAQDSSTYFIDGSTKQKIAVIRKQFAPNDPTIKKFVEKVSETAKKLKVEIIDK